jgi:hypothetical protein
MKKLNSNWGEEFNKNGTLKVDPSKLVKNADG